MLMRTNPPSFARRCAEVAVLLLLVASLLAWWAWMRSPERSALLLDEGIATLRQEIASERATAIRDAADCMADSVEFGAAFGGAVCEFARSQMEPRRERMAALAARLADLEGQRIKVADRGAR